MVIIGDVRSTREEENIEWKIPHFLQLSRSRHVSPKFSFCNEEWEIMIDPNGYHFNASYISLYLTQMSLKAPISVDYSFHFKTVDGKADSDAKFKKTHAFHRVSNSSGTDIFMSRSKLIERQSELLPSGVLTVICTMKKTGTNDGDWSATVDEFTQTEEETGSATVHVFTQTEEETGVLKLQQHSKDILENENVSDVVLKVEGREFKSHRCVLAARSPVFLAMMTHDTKEKDTGIVDIKDVDPNTFSDFLRYLYTGSGQIITQDNVVKLYTAADKYQVDDLKKSCLDHMLMNVSIDNFCDILSLSLEHVERDLTDVCSRFFIENTVAVISTPMWLIFLKENPVASNELHLKQLKNNMKNKN